MFHMMKIIWLVVSTYPSEKYESQLGFFKIPNMMGKMKAMFQTTNQVRDKKEMQY